MGSNACRSSLLGGIMVICGVAPPTVRVASGELVTRSTATDVSMRAGKEVVMLFAYVCVGATAAAAIIIDLCV